jgi:hypothetical protein
MLIARIKSPIIPFSKLLLPSPIPSGPAPHNNEDLFTRLRLLVAYVLWRRVQYYVNKALAGNPWIAKKAL